MSTQPQSHILRQTVIDALTKLPELSGKKDLVENIERGVFNTTLDVANRQNVRRYWEDARFCQCYKAVARRVITNLDPSSYVGNKRLLSRLLAGEFAPHQVASMQTQELYPEIWKEIEDKQAQKLSRMFEVNKSMATDQFLCKRCKKRECEFYERQTRSADEPMTVFITCLNCGNRWRQ
jgi:transcription elongation factor S-II